MSIGALSPFPPLHPALQGLFRTVRSVSVTSHQTCSLETMQLVIVCMVLS